MRRGPPIGAPAPDPGDSNDDGDRSGRSQGRDDRGRDVDEGAELTRDFISEVIERKRAESRDLVPESEVALPENRSRRRRRREPTAPSTFDPDEEELEAEGDQYAPDNKTYIHDALPAVWMEHDLTPVQIAVVYHLVAVAGFNIKYGNRRYASCGHRQIAKALAWTVPARTVLRHLQGLAKGYKTRGGGWAPGKQLIRIVPRKHRRRTVADLMPLYDEIDKFRPGAKAFLLRRSRRKDGGE